MTDTPERLEAAVLAHRKLIAELLTLVRGTPAGERMIEALEDRAQVHDGEEDPGVLLDTGYSIEAGIAAEIALVLRMAGDFSARR